MTKSERNEANKAMCYASMGYFDMAARVMSMLIRAASKKSRNELITMAAGYPTVVQHSEFII